ncbi:MULTISPECIES: glutamate 5-kinase [unclassified Halanaerobium]|uniref:glutamate 5-kinase n=1 Tax=unclassified Halanaerobium TaxID=2641197 RepID=UPI000DF336D2|nr:MULTISPECIES: glutamate 5-kinase [unclassified Halanaerobium]RCW49251.1 glutamate 5-kinase [Halanaerobium sp. MA284_MarDTE_T2]RCW83990.1 glutamate 5-kinase [Halanaerobium sp. DL-01]
MDFKRIVVKVGSSSISNQNAKLNFSQIEALTRQLVDLENQGREMILVSSGAIAAGMGELGYAKKPVSIPEQQACAAVGQGVLIGIYNKFFREYGAKCAQILLTSSDLENRNRYLNAFNTLKTLIDYGIIPVINENDTVVTNEIKVGDNDRLAARVAGLVEADLLINLSDVPGLYNGNPSEKSDKLKLISKVEKITEEIEKMAGGKGSKIGTGGMMTKIAAAKIAVNSGIMMIIGPGHDRNIILKLVEMAEKEKTNIGTTFMPCSDSLCKRKQWLNYNITPAGKLIVDEGAAEALKKRGKSLLPGGIKDVEGEFNAGELVIIEDFTGEFARGLVNYSSDEIQQIKGRHSNKISEVLGYYNQAEVVHRDNMVLGGDK